MRLTAYVRKVCRSLLATLASVFTNRLVLLQAGHVLEPDYNNDNLFAVGDWFKAMGNDPTNRRFGVVWVRICHLIVRGA